MLLLKDMVWIKSWRSDIDSFTVLLYIGNNMDSITIQDLIRKTVKDKNGSIDMKTAFQVVEAARINPSFDAECVECLRKELILSQSNVKAQLSHVKLTHICLQHLGINFAQKLYKMKLIDCLQAILFKNTTDVDLQCISMAIILIMCQLMPERHPVHEIYQRIVAHGIFLQEPGSRRVSNSSRAYCKICKGDHCNVTSKEVDALYNIESTQFVMHKGGVGEPYRRRSTLSHFPLEYEKCIYSFVALVDACKNLSMPEFLFNTQLHQLYRDIVKIKLRLNTELDQTMRAYLFVNDLNNKLLSLMAMYEAKSNLLLKNTAYQVDDDIKHRLVLSLQKIHPPYPNDLEIFPEMPEEISHTNAVRNCLVSPTDTFKTPYPTQEEEMHDVCFAYTNITERKG